MASFLLEPETLDHGILSRLPPCPARQAGGSCALCGLSHAFLAIGRGDVAQAAALHSGSLWIYGALVVVWLAGTWTTLGLLAALVRGRVAKADLHR